LNTQGNNSRTKNEKILIPYGDIMDFIEKIKNYNVYEDETLDFLTKLNCEEFEQLIALDIYPTY
jgi:hypothetical protein